MDAMSAITGALGAVGSVLDTPRRLLYGGGNALYKGLTGDQGPDINNFGDILGRMGMDKDSYLTKALGFAGDMATDPLTYLGGFGGGQLAKGLEMGDEALTAATRGASSLADAGGLKGLRSGVAAFKDVAPAAADALPEAFERGAGSAIGSDAGGGMAGRVVGGKSMMPGQIEGKFDTAAQRIADNPQYAGAYLPDQNATVLPEGAGPRVTRHENVHALIDQAAKTGQADQLPLLMRIPAQLLSGGRDAATMTGALGTVGDELAAQSLENRGLLKQLQGGANFLFNPSVNSGYAASYAAGGMNPAVLAAYQAMGKAPAAAGALAGHSASPLLSMLGGQQ